MWQVGPLQRSVDGRVNVWLLYNEWNRLWYVLQMQSGMGRWEDRKKVTWEICATDPRRWPVQCSVCMCPFNSHLMRRLSNLPYRFHSWSPLSTIILFIWILLPEKARSGKAFQVKPTFETLNWFLSSRNLVRSLCLHLTCIYILSELDFFLWKVPIEMVF